MRNTYFLLRHGETVYQTKKKDIVYSWPEVVPVKLTKKGEKQIKKAARLLRKKKIDRIVSSDVFRARQTAEIVAKMLGLEVIFDKKLRDINLGVYCGRKKEEFYRDFPRGAKKRFYKRPKGGESWSDVKRRMTDFIKDIEKKHKRERILIISHGDPLWILEGIIRKLNNKELLDEIFVKKNYIKTGELRKL